MAPIRSALLYGAPNMFPGGANQQLTAAVLVEEDNRTRAVDHALLEHREDKGHERRFTLPMGPNIAVMPTSCSCGM